MRIGGGRICDPLTDAGECTSPHRYAKRCWRVAGLQKRHIEL